VGRGLGLGLGLGLGSGLAFPKSAYRVTADNTLGSEVFTKPVHVVSIFSNNYSDVGGTSFLFLVTTTLMWEAHRFYF